MPSARELALRHYTARQRLVRSTAAAGRRLWNQVDPADLSRSWIPLLARLLVVVTGAQLAAARAANDYVAGTLAAQGLESEPAGEVVAQSLAGIASDGRELASLLLNPVIATKKMISQQLATEGRIRLDSALATGQTTLEMTLRTQIADAGRVADGVAVAARPRTGYVRMLVGDSCPRCAILAGRFYRYNAGFERHPNCDCTSIPTVEDVAGDLATDPQLAFREGRVRGLSKADEKAIRDGADIGQVVNAHRGVYTAGGQKRTREGITRQGFAGARLRGQVRLMPEQIYREATSRDEAVQLLRAHGYII
ncbi:hypothetical protein [Amycolatopsis sp. NPDC001319]|uniref:VG15 protein n=1 Tax=unclassified Amycolatopsis TaxID=2618356 RepID=UPI0036763761